MLYRKSRIPRAELVLQDSDYRLGPQIATVCKTKHGCGKSMRVGAYAGVAIG